MIPSPPGQKPEIGERRHDRSEEQRPENGPGRAAPHDQHPDLARRRPLRLRDRGADALAILRRQEFLGLHHEPPAPPPPNEPPPPDHPPPPPPPLPHPPPRPPDIIPPIM